MEFSSTSTTALIENPPYGSFRVVKCGSIYYYVHSPNEVHLTIYEWVRLFVQHFPEWEHLPSDEALILYGSDVPMTALYAFRASEIVHYQNNRANRLHISTHNYAPYTLHYGMVLRFEDSLNYYMLASKDTPAFSWTFEDWIKMFDYHFPQISSKLNGDLKITLDQGIRSLDRGMTFGNGVNVYSPSKKQILRALSPYALIGPITPKWTVNDILLGVVEESVEWIDKDGSTCAYLRVKTRSIDAALAEYGKHANVKLFGRDGNCHIHAALPDDMPDFYLRFGSCKPYFISTKNKQHIPLLQCRLDHVFDGHLTFDERMTLPTHILHFIKKGLISDSRS